MSEQTKEQDEELITIRLHRGHAHALSLLVGARPHDEQWSKVVYDSIRAAFKVDQP